MDLPVFSKAWQSFPSHLSILPLTLLLDPDTFPEHTQGVGAPMWGMVRGYGATGGGGEGLGLGMGGVGQNGAFPPSCFGDGI